MSGFLAAGGSFTPSPKIPATAGSSALGGTPPANLLKYKDGYVYSTRSNNVVVVDVTNPAAPTLVSYTTFGAVGLSRFDISGRYLYVIDGSGGIFRVLDISNPNAHTAVGTVTDATNLDNGNAVVVSGGIAYVGNAAATGKITAVDIKNPVAPIVGSVASSANLNGLEDMVIRGRYIYAAAFNGNRLTIVDTTTMTVVGSVNDALLTGASGVVVSGEYAYVAAQSGTGGGRVVVVNIEDPTAPTITSSLAVASAVKLTICDNVLYVATSANPALIHVINASNPAALSSLGSFSLAEAGQGVSTNIAVQGRYGYTFGITNFFVLDLKTLEIASANIGAIKANNVDVTDLIQANRISSQGIAAGINGFKSDGLGVFSARITSPSSSANSEQFGYGATAGASCVAVGTSATTTSTRGTAIGNSATADLAAVAVGAGAIANATSAVSIGDNATNNGGTQTVAIGQNANSDTNTVTIGYSSAARPLGSIAIGCPDATPVYTRISAGATDRSILIGQGVAIDATGGGVILGGTAAVTTSVTGVVIVGLGATATTASSTVVGNSASGTGSLSSVFGANASVNSANGVAIGRAASVSAADGTALGNGAATGVTNGITIGRNAGLSAGATSRSIVIGQGASFDGSGGGILIGGTAAATSYAPTVLIGLNSSVGSNDSVVVGANASTTSSQSVAIGNGTISDVNATSLGFGAQANVSGSIAIGAHDGVATYTRILAGATARSVIVGTGNRFTATGGGVILGGPTGDTTVTGVVIVGLGAAATAANGTAIGSSASAGSAGSIALGASSTTTAANQIVIGSASVAVNTLILGEGDTDATPPATVTIRPTDATVAGTGSTLAIRAGSGGASGTAGAVTVTGGAGGGTSGAAGSVTIQGGTPVNGAGGDVNITGSNGVGTNRAGGAVAITAGNSVGTATAGAITITGGTGGTSGAAGTVTIQGGQGGTTTGIPGQVNIYAGVPNGSGDVAGADIDIRATNGSSGGGAVIGGKITLATGQGSGGGANGYINFRSGSTTADRWQIGGTLGSLTKQSQGTYILTERLVTANTTDPLALAHTDSWTCFTNEGASALINFTLPTAAAGMQFTFIVQDADGIQVDASAGDTIRIAGSVSAAAGNISSTTIGSAVTLLAINATEWISIANNGSWTVT